MSVEWDFLITLNEQLRPLKDPVEIQEVAVRLIGEHLHASRVNYANIDGDEFVISQSYAESGPPSSGRGAIARYGKAIVDACRRGETVAADDVNTDPRFTDAERAQLLAGQTAAFVGTPLIKDGRWLATFGVHSATPRTWTRDQIALVEIAADRTWSAAERARAEDALGQSESRQAFLHRLNEAIRPLADPARILQEACRLLGTYLGVNRVAYGEVEGDDCIIVHDYVDGLPSLAGRIQWRNLGGSRTGDILKGWTLSVNDTSTESHTPEERAALEAAGIRAYICPLLIKDGRFVGAFGIHSRSPRVWTAYEIALVQEVADRIWATLEHRRAEAELRANEERLAFLLRLNDALRPLSDAAAIQEIAARHLCEHLGAARVGYAELGGARVHHSPRARPRRRAARRNAPANRCGGHTGRGSPARRDHRGQRRASRSAAQRRRPSGVRVAADRGVGRRGAAQRRADGCRVRCQSRHAARVDDGRDRARSRGRRADLGRCRAHPRRSGATGTENAAPARARSIRRRLLDMGPPHERRRLGRRLPRTIRVHAGRTAVI